MPADLDELFSALGAHADRIPVGTPEGARRRGERRRRRHRAAGLALVLVAAAGGVGIARFPDQSAPPAAPTTTPAPAPTVNFSPLVRAGTVPMDLQATEDPTSWQALVPMIVDGVAYVMGGRAPVWLGALDLASGEPVFPTVDLGTWDSPPYGLWWGPPGLAVRGVPEGATNEILTIIDPSSGTVRWRLDIDDATSVLRSAVAVVTYTRASGVLRALDWHSGAELWRREAPAVGSVMVDYAGGPWQPGSRLDQALHSDRLFLYNGRDSVEVLDPRTGQTHSIISIDVSRNPAGIIDGILYTEGGGELWAQPVDGPGAPTLVYRHSDPRPRTLGVEPCGTVLCVRPHGQANDRVVLLDPDTYHEITTVSPGTFGSAIGDRFLTYQGLLLDLTTGAAVGESTRAPRQAWWLTAGSALIVTYSGEVIGLQTADGTPVLLGDIPHTVAEACSADERYLVCPAPDGFHAWRFAAG